MRCQNQVCSRGIACEKHFRKLVHLQKMIANEGLDKGENGYGNFVYGRTTTGH